ncbi:MAG: hypothetical protein MHM6MM_002572 [Cercozoa sp. M6MM]
MRRHLVQRRSIAFIFPGQGAQHVGMARDLHEHSAAARLVMEQADRILKRSLSHTMFQGPSERLNRTENAQPALFVHSAMAMAALQETLLESDVPDEVWRNESVYAGHSLGEFSALHAAGCLDFETALRLVQVRAGAMQECCDRHAGSMAVLMPVTDVDAIHRLCTEITCDQSDHSDQNDRVVTVANINTAAQVVVSGHRDCVERAMRLAKERRKQTGVRKATLLPVSGAFHSPHMQEAVRVMTDTLADTEFADIDAATLVLSSSTARHFRADADELRQQLAQQVVQPVRWQQCTELLCRDNDLVVQVGTGDALCAMTKRTCPNTETFAISTADDVRELACQVVI